MLICFSIHEARGIEEEPVKTLEMTRRKIKIQRIENERARKSTLKRRMAGLFKKVRELSVLCGVEAGVIINNRKDDPVFFPSHQEMEQMFKRLMIVPEMERNKKLVTQESYLKERVKKEMDKISRDERKNSEKELEEIMNQLIRGKDLNELDVTRLNGLYWLSAEKLKQLEQRNQELDRQGSSALPSPQLQQKDSLPLHPLPQVAPPMAASEEVGQIHSLSGDHRTSIHELVKKSMNDQHILDPADQVNGITGPTGGKYMGL
ncbi:unnamed protein product [Ilex paraguariensis]|uniref:MADS-box domain-containing protein n=1 Tax=Ilex paraguariensis TaxID=185542 RepID=A0ABC8R2B0_9AQUA